MDESAQQEQKLKDLPLVLAVDDLPSNLVALRHTLADFDIDLIEVSSGNDALGVILEKEVAVIILDVSMPDMSGIEVAKLLRQSKKTRHIPIIFMTAIDKEEKYIMQGYSEGAVDYLFKPVDPYILRAKVDVFIRLYNNHKALKELNQTQKITLAKLASANMKLEKFASHAAHDLRGGVNSMGNLAAQISDIFTSEKFTPSKEMTACVDFINSHSQRMRQLIDDLYSYATLCVYAEKSETVDLNKLIENELSFLDYQLIESKAKVVVEHLPCIKGQPTLLRQAIRNLLSNALKYAEPARKPEIKITARVRGKDCLLSIEDNGLGVPDSMIERIFEPFVRAHKEEHLMGTGLGLSIVEEVVRWHQGDVSVESEPGKGSRFTLRL